MKTILTLLLSAFALLAQDGKLHYVAHKETSLSSAVEKVTIQQPSTGAKTVTFTGAALYSSVAATFTLSQAGTPATNTALTPTPLNQAPAATAKAFYSSDVGSGTTVVPYHVAAGQTLPIDLSSFYFAGNGITQNLTIASSSVTGTVSIDITWDER